VKRATQAQHTQRLNAAIRLLARQAAPDRAAERLATRWRMSLRQAYRYVQRAERCPQPLPVPEAKTVFTVKLPRGLLRKVRQRARRKEQPISQWVSRALETLLETEPEHG
jgi:hypothetical protein